MVKHRRTQNYYFKLLSGGFPGIPGKTCSVGIRQHPPLQTAKARKLRCYRKMVHRMMMVGYHKIFSGMAKLLCRFTEGFYLAPVSSNIHRSTSRGAFRRKVCSAYLIIDSPTPPSTHEKPSGGKTPLGNKHAVFLSLGCQVLGGAQS